MITNPTRLPGRFVLLSTHPDLRIRQPYPKKSEHLLFLILPAAFFVIFLVGLWTSLDYLDAYLHSRPVQISEGGPIYDKVALISLLKLTWGGTCATGIVVLGALYSGWQSYFEIDFHATITELTITTRRLGYTHTVIVTRSDLHYFCLFLLEYDRQSGGTWQLEAVTHQRRPAKQYVRPGWMPVRWMPDHRIARKNYKTIEIFENDLSVVDWLGTQLSNFFRVELLRS
jgi:hypothetical protein